jgi:mono/diheme cytochrome c family protein
MLRAALAFVLAAVTGCTTSPSAPPSAPAGDAVEGLRVATRVGCKGCHRRDGRGGELWAEEGQYKLYAPNLTDKRGLYDDAALKALLRDGRTADGHRPFGMPFVQFQHLSDRELRDITAWLRALPTVANPGLPQTWIAPAIRHDFDAGAYQPEIDWRPRPGVTASAVPPTETLALGRHLAMTSCSECHGPTLDGWPGEDEAPPLVVAKGYTLELFTRLMRTGITVSGLKSKTGLMSEMGRERFPVMNDEEVRALKAYLDARPTGDAADPSAPARP